MKDENPVGLQQTAIAKAQTKGLVRVMHVSDLHFSVKHAAEAARTLIYAAKKAIKEKADCFIVTGDSTDHAMQMQSPVVRELARIIKGVAQHMPVLMLQGTFSHEPPGFLRLLAMMEAKYPIAVCDTVGSWALVDGAFVPMTPDVNPRMVVHALPTLNKADVAALDVGKEGDAGQTAHSIVASVLDSWAPVNRKLRLAGIPSVVISHGTVLNSISEHGVPMAGNDHEFTLGDLFSAHADAVMLGHIHLHQYWESADLGFKQTVAYAGSIGRFHYGEEGDKYCLLWDMQAGNTNFEACPTPSRRNIDLQFVGVPDLDELRKQAGDYAGAYIRVRYEIDQESTASVSHAAIRAALSEAAEVHIERITLTIQREASNGISQKQSVADKLGMWAAQTNTPDIEGLQSRLEQLQAGDPASIVAGLMGSIRRGVFQEAKQETAPKPQAKAVASIESPTAFSEALPVEYSTSAMFEEKNLVPF